MATWIPIWKRLNYDIKTEMSLAGDSVRYRIRVADTEGDATDPYEGRVIHEGIASAAPNDTTSIWISPNEVAANYLGGDLGAMHFGWHSQILARFFAVDYWDNGDWLYAANWGFYANWSYDHAFDIEAMGLSHPIRAVAAPNQWLVASVLDWDDARAVDFVLIFKDGSEVRQTIDLGGIGDFNNDFNADFFFSGGDAYSVGGYAAVYLGAFINLARVQLIYGGLGDYVIADYAVMQECKRYALYYRNAYGGMDSLLLDGVQKGETYARSTITRNIDNSVQGARAIQNYRNGVVEGWELRLNALTDEAASRMHHLVGSAEVYLCDLIADTLTPLVLTDSECVARTFANGHKRLDWKLAATTAQVMRRE